MTNHALVKGQDQFALSVLYLRAMFIQRRGRFFETPRHQGALNAAQFDGRSAPPQKKRTQNDRNSP
jgi:hypothetical protein